MPSGEALSKQEVFAGRLLQFKLFRWVSELKSKWHQLFSLHFSVKVCFFTALDTRFGDLGPSVEKAVGREIS